MNYSSLVKNKPYLMFFVIGFLLVGCTYSKPLMVEKSTCGDSKEIQSQSLTVLKPIFIIDSTTIKPPPPEDLEEAKQSIMEHLQTELTARGFHLTTESQLDQTNQDQISKTKTLLENTGILFKPHKRCKELGKHWNYLGDIGFVAFTGIRIQGTTMIGQRPLGGGVIGGEKIRSNVFISIIDPQESKILWLRESFSRSRPLGANWQWYMWDDGSNESAIRESIELILSEFPKPRG